jgi:cytochrome c-type biogenesis protein CcmH
LLLVSLAFVLVVAAVGYATHGRLDAWRGGPPSAPADAGSPEAQIAAMVGKLEERLKTTPEDAEGWTMLGRSYSVLGRYADADAAYRKVVALRPNDAQAYADRADALAMASGRKLAGEPEKLIARALELDPKNLKALALAGTIAFDRGDYLGAARHWETAVAVGDPASDLVRNLQSGVVEARARAGAAAPVVAGASAAGPLAAAAVPAQAPAAAAGGQVSGRVALAPELKGKAAEEDTVFVFARAVDGPRAPLAVLRKQVKDLPFEFKLDDSMAMNAALRLSSAAQVVVSARISRSGNAVPQPGDLQGASPAVKVGAQDLQIVITEVVK